MTQFNPKGPQEFDEKVFPVLVQKGDEIFISPEVGELLSEIGPEALKVLDGAGLKHFSYWENLEIASKTDFVDIYSRNIYPFVLENKKIILDKLKK